MQGRVSKFTQDEQERHARRATTESVKQVATELGVSLDSISRWRKRFDVQRLDRRNGNGCPKPTPAPVIDESQWLRVLDRMWADVEEQYYLHGHTTPLPYD